MAIISKTSILKSAFALALIADFTAGVSPSLAQTPNGGQPPAPPPEAFQACGGLSSGAACQVKAPDSSVHKGVCWAPANMKLACIPNDRPAKPPQAGH